MKKTWKRLLTWTLCLALVLSYGAMAADMMPMDGMGPPPDGDMGGGGAPPPGDGAPETAAIVITDGAENPDAEYEPGAYSSYISGVDGVLTINGLSLTSGDYTFNGLVATGPDSVVRLQKCTIRLGTEAPATDDDTGGAATNIDNGATLYISDSELTVDGAARYVTANYNDATLIVNNSTVTSTGSNDNTADVSEPFSNAALLIMTRFAPQRAGRHCLRIPPPAPVWISMPTTLRALRKTAAILPMPTPIAGYGSMAAG